VGEPAITAIDVTKSFVVHTQRASSLKERLVRRDRGGKHTFDALKDVSVEIARGHTVGLIGANGSGKSTFLKVLAGIIRPTSGTVEANGRIASLLELGAGFNSELSGRDNVFLNASLLGLSRAETRALFDSIVGFSELAEFIDQPVKHYSSGMYVRLGFSVAVHVDPDILLVDEVLAVGDEAFARKCLDKINSFQREGRTILLVSHDLGLVEQLCDRVVVLDHGHVVFDGDPSFATGTLRGILGTDDPVFTAIDNVPGIVITEIVVSAEPGGPLLAEFRAGEPMALRVGLDIRADQAGAPAELMAVVMGAGGLPVWSMRVSGDAVPSGAGTWAVDFLATCPAVLGGFQVAVQLSGADGVPLAVRQGSDVFWVRGDARVGLLDLPYRVEVSAT